MLPKIHNSPVIAYAQTEIQSTGPCGIILVEKANGEWVTAWYRVGEREWVYGHYFFKELEAYADFLDRVREHKRIPKPEPVKPATKRRKASTL